MKKLLESLEIPPKFWWWILGILLIIIIGSLSQYFLGKDNRLEEAIEDLIENQTGLDMDLSKGEETWKSPFLS